MESHEIDPLALISSIVPSLPPHKLAEAARYIQVLCYFDPLPDDDDVKPAKRAARARHDRQGWGVKPDGAMVTHARAAAWLQRAPATLSNWTRKAGFPQMRKGTHVYVVADIQAWLDRTGGGAPPHANAPAAAFDRWQARVLARGLS